MTRPRRHPAAAPLLLGLASCAATTAAEEAPGPVPVSTPPPGDPPQLGHDRGKSYIVPAVEIVGFELALNQFDRHYVDEEDYATDSDSISDNLHHAWVIDQDSFETNQFLHPYQGSIYHGFARSAGLSYWTALLYDFAGSALWEVAGETSPPSLNDQITTTFGGSFLGEALFLMASAV